MSPRPNMPAITAACPACGEEIEFGKDVTACPKCAHEFTMAEFNAIMEADKPEMPEGTEAPEGVVAPDAQPDTGTSIA